VATEVKNMRVRLQLLPALLLLVAALPANAQEKRLTVKYRSAGNVYLDGGSADSIAVGDHVTALSRGETIAELEVVFIAERSASCRILSEKRPVQAGDIVVVKAKPAAPAEAPAVTTATVTPAPEAPVAQASSAPVERRPWARARGGVSVGLYRLWDDTPANYDFEQRTGRADLTLWDILGKPLEFSFRLRSRQDVRHRPPGFEGIPRDERLDRLYELALRYQPVDGTVRWEVGRIGASPIGIGYLDGALAAYRLVPALEVGGFFGNRPNIDSYASLPTGRKYGGFLRLLGGRGYSPGAYDGIAFFVREFVGSEVSREYVGLQGRLASGRFTSFQWAEVDLNRGWRQDLAGNTVQLSNLSVTGSYRVSNVFQASISYDQRRNYWTQEIRPLPEVLFDRFLHQGFRASLDLFRPSSIGASGSFGVRRDEKDNVTSYSWSAGLRHPQFLGLFVSVDGSGYTNPLTDGYLASARIGRSLRRVQIDVAYGASLYKLKAAAQNPIPGLTPNRLNQWGRASARVELPRGLYLQGDFEYDTGDDLKGPRVLAELGYRF
jgi:hypothetical protein